MKQLCKQAHSELEGADLLGKVVHCPVLPLFGESAW